MGGFSRSNKRKNSIVVAKKLKKQLRRKNNKLKKKGGYERAVPVIPPKYIYSRLPKQF